MTAKLAVTILAFGLMAAAMLSTRQSRLQAAHEVTEARLRIRAHDERLLELRAEIAGRVSPARVREMLEETGQRDTLAPLAERVREPGEAVDEDRPGEVGGETDES